MAKFLDFLRGKQPAHVEKSGTPADWVFDGSIPASWPVSWWQQGYDAPGKRKTAVVQASVDAYAQTIASVPPYHQRYDDVDTKTRVRTSAASRVMYRPNGYQTRSDFFLNAVEALLFHGNCYMLGFRNDRNEISEVHLLDPRGTQPYVDTDQSIYYAAGENPLLGELQYMIPARDVCHIRLYTPRHPLVGVSPIENIAGSIAANAAITGHQATFFTNMSRPSGVLSTEMKLTADQMMQLRKAWEAQSKNMNSGGIPILGNGIKWSPMSISSQDAQLVDAFNMTVEDIARAFRVPLPLVNDNRHSTYNNVEQLISHWLSGGLGFMIDHIENNLDRFFNFDQYNRIEFETDMLMRTDFAGRVDGYTKAIQFGLMAPNEARSRFSGLKQVEHGDKPMVQQQMVPLGWTEQQPAPEPAPAVEPAPDEEAQRGLAIYFLKKAMNDG